MKISMLLICLSLSTNALAGGAVTYNCVGKDQSTKQAVVFELMFGSGGRGGYQNMPITIEKIGYEKFKKPVVFQMYEATSANECARNADGETYLNEFEMAPTPEGNLAAYEVRFKTKCVNTPTLDVQAYCFFQH